VVELATNIIKYLIDLTFYVLYDTIGDVKLRYNLDVCVQQTLFSPSPIARFVRDRQFPVHDGMNSLTDTESNGIVDIYGCSTVTTALNGPFLTQGHETDRRTDGRTTALLNAPSLRALSVMTEGSPTPVLESVIIYYWLFFINQCRLRKPGPDFQNSLRFIIRLS